MLFDNRYNDLKNSKQKCSPGCYLLIQSKRYRQASKERSDKHAFSDILIPPQGFQVHLEGYGWINVLRDFGPDGEVEGSVTSQRSMPLKDTACRVLHTWQVEVYRRGLKHVASSASRQHPLMKEIRQCPPFRDSSTSH